ncbi:MAG: M20 family metallopeptidase [Rhodobacter sp.]|jgi:hippurate hydrolase|nr:M20 family metallopeptidase [Rhodobacter sp.]
MPVINRIGDYTSEMKEWRQWMHRNPELGFDLHKTAGFVADRLREFGVDEIHEGIANTGIVAIINGQGAAASGGTCIGLRADMDALPIEEATGADYASETPGKMHACGHDGHTTMLLGAAKYLAETRNFSGRVALIFQPAEEGGGGGEVMVQEGIMDRFGIAQVYGIHNAPLYETGRFYTTPGPIMAAVDEFRIEVNGVGGHGAWPHESKDPVMAAVAMIQAIYSIVSRNHRAVEDLVISVCQIHTGTADNVIPAQARFSGTIRTFNKDVRAMVFRRIEEIVKGHELAFDVTAVLEIAEGYPATVNDAASVEFAAGVAADVVGADRVATDAIREMGAEDFSYMLESRPGAYLFLGQGETAYCHHPAYDFNDEIAPIGASFFARLVECAQPLR